MFILYISTICCYAQVSVCLTNVYIKSRLMREIVFQSIHRATDIARRRLTMAANAHYAKSSRARHAKKINIYLPSHI